MEVGVLMVQWSSPYSRPQPECRMVSPSWSQGKPSMCLITLTALRSRMAFRPQSSLWQDRYENNTLKSITLQEVSQPHHYRFHTSSQRASTFSDRPRMDKQDFLGSLKCMHLGHGCPLNDICILSCPGKRITEEKCPNNEIANEICENKVDSEVLSFSQYLIDQYISVWTVFRVILWPVSRNVPSAGGGTCVWCDNVSSKPIQDGWRWQQHSGEYL